MFEPVRGGTRGGQAEFKWTDVSADKDREHYLGHSINAPTGRWQKNKDIHWYNRDAKQSESERIEEIRKIKELEAHAISAVLGYETTIGNSSGPASGSNAIVVPSTNANSAEAETKLKDKEERRLKREEKKARKELKRRGRSAAHSVSDLAERPVRRPSRSRSPRYRSRERKSADDRKARSRSRSRTPNERRTSRSEYDAVDRERERESDRRRWDYNSRRNQPLDGRRY